MRKKKEIPAYESGYERALKEYNEKMKDPKFLKKQKRIELFQWIIFILIGSGFLMLLLGVTWGMIFIFALFLDSGSFFHSSPQNQQ
jgi:hypothetical protein